MAMESSDLNGIIYLAIIAFMFGGGFGFGGFGGNAAGAAACDKPNLIHTELGVSPLSLQSCLKTS